MTISSTTVKNSYNGDSSTTTFSYTFKIFANTDLQVIIRSALGTETVKTLTTHYTVTGAGSASGGSVTFTAGNIPATGETVVLRRAVPQTQAIDYIANDPFPAESHEEGLDRAMMTLQQLQEEVTRSIKLSRTNTMTSTEFTVGSSDRANKILAFDENGEISVTQELGTFVGNWSASTTFNARDIVKDTSNNNIYICNTTHTSSGSLPISSNADSAKWNLLVDAASATASATAAASSATAAANSASAAASSESNAATSESNAATSESNAATSESNAASSASTASTQATNAANSATSASNSATTATTQATNAANSATSASNSATTATTQATNASNSATAAASSASTATAQASAASTSATNAANSASSASTSATNASNSATSAASSASAAAASAASIDAFYLGALSSNPTVDGNGDPVTAGDWYFNTSSNETRIYNGSTWQVTAVSTAGLLVASNNLSDITSAPTARTNLGLGTAATESIATLQDIVNDVTPQLGGNLDLNSNDITGTGNVTITGTILPTKAYIAEATLTDGATIDWNMATQAVAKVTLGGNRTLNAPTNGSTGQFASILVIQDGTGSRTLTWNAVYEFTADTAPTLTTTANYGDLFTFRYNGAKWLEVGRNLNLVLS